MAHLHHQIRRTIRRHDLCPPGTGLIVGLSGGSDSVALALLLRELGEQDGYSVVGLAHLNHRLREAAGADEQFCRQFAERVGLPIVVETIDVASYARDQRLSVENAARRVRYDFLERAAQSLGATRIAVGHTRDDQAETFLLKLLRGAGLTGLGGIYPRRERVVRPLLDVSRAELRSYLGSRGQAWVEDETNVDMGNPRNRIRHIVLPELDRVIGGATSPAIARAAAIVREDGRWLDELSDRRIAGIVVRGVGGLEIESAALRAEPDPIRRRIILSALRMTAPNREIGLEHVEAALEVASGACAGADLPGVRVELRRQKLVLLKRGL